MKLDYNCFDTCYSKLSSQSKESAACAIIGLLPKGAVWDAQRELYFKHNDKNKTSLAHFAAFLGLLIHNIAIKYTDVMIANSQPFTAITNLDYWLNAYNWDYSNISFDFSPEGLYCLKEVTIDGIKQYVRSDIDLSIYNIAIKKSNNKYFSY